MKHLILIIVILAVSCGRTQNSGTGELEPFEISITSYNYAAAYGVQYLLTEQELKIIFKGELEGEQDTILFSVSLTPNEKLRTLGNLNLDSLKDQYENPCILDGSQISVRIRKNNKQKNVHLSNYYQEDIGLAIEIMNSLTPEEFKIWYDRDRLLERQINCENSQAVHDFKRAEPENLFNQDSTFTICEFDSFSNYPTDHSGAFDCTNWELGEPDLTQIIKKSSIARIEEWRLLFSDYPCVYRGTLTQNERQFKFEINGAKWLSLTSDTTVFYADFYGTLDELFNGIERTKLE